MKCYFRVDSGPWRTGKATSFSGGRELVFEAAGNIVIKVWNPEIMFCYGTIRVTGYVSVGRDLYQLTSIEVRFFKNKEMKE